MSPPTSETHAITARTRPVEPTDRSTPASAGRHKAHALDPAGDDVGRGQLLGRTGKRRCERGLRLARQRDDRRRNRRQRVRQGAGAPASSEAAVALSATACTP